MMAAWWTGEHYAHPSHRHHRSRRASSGVDVEVGPWVHGRSRRRAWAIDCRLGPRATLRAARAARSGRERGRGHDAGRRPAGLKFSGEETWVEIGAGTLIREYSHHQPRHHRHRAHGRGGQLLPHDLRARGARLPCWATMSSSRTRTQMAGHVTMQDHAILSGLNAVHQFVTIGELCVHRRRLAGEPGHAAVRQGGGEPDGTVRAQYDRAAARRLRRRDGRRRSSGPTGSFFNSDLNLAQAPSRGRASDLPPLARGRAVPARSWSRPARGVPA